MSSNIESFYKKYKCDTVLALLFVLVILYVFVPKMIENFEAYNDNDTKHYMPVAPNSTASKPATVGLDRIPNNTPSISNRPDQSRRNMN